MIGSDFLDTNILVYAYDSAAEDKAPVARQLVERVLTGNAVISSQVLGEFAATMLRTGMGAAGVVDILTKFQNLRLVETDALLVRRAVEAHAVYGLHFYDGMIVAAAERAGCLRLLSEDFNAGQQYFGVLAVNPFE